MIRTGIWREITAKVSNRIDGLCVDCRSRENDLVRRTRFASQIARPGRRRVRCTSAQRTRLAWQQLCGSDPATASLTRPLTSVTRGLTRPLTGHQHATKLLEPDPGPRPLTRPLTSVTRGLTRGREGVLAPPMHPSQDSLMKLDTSGTQLKISPIPAKKILCASSN